MLVFLSSTSLTPTPGLSFLLCLPLLASLSVLGTPFTLPNLLCIHFYPAPHRKADLQELHQLIPLSSSSGWFQPTGKLWKKIEGKDKSEIRLFILRLSPCRITLGQWYPLFKGLSSFHDSLLCIMTFSFWVPVTAPSPPFLDLGLVTAVFLLAQGAALTLEASSELCK